MNTSKHHPSYEQVTQAWNAQADEHNQWDDLGEDEKIEWAAKYGAAQALASAAGASLADKPYRYFWEELDHVDNGPAWLDMYRDYDPRLPENRQYHSCDFENPAQVRNFTPLYRRAAALAAPAEVSDDVINTIADGLFDHQQIGGRVPGQDRDEFRELIGSAIAEFALSMPATVSGGWVAAAPAHSADGVPVAAVPTAELKAILADADIGPPVDTKWCCLECGKWTPWQHPEAHDHEDDCSAPNQYAQRRNWKARLSALIAAASAHSAEAGPMPVTVTDAVCQEVAQHLQATCAAWDGIGMLDVREVVKQVQARVAPAASQPAPQAMHTDVSDASEIFAWATFDGEGGYDLRLYAENENYRDEFIQRNGPKYAGWVIALTPLSASAAASQPATPGYREVLAERVKKSAEHWAYLVEIDNTDAAVVAREQHAALVAQLAATPTGVVEPSLIDWDSAHKIAYQAAAAFRPSYFNGAGFMAHNWVVEAIRSGHLDGQRHALGLPGIDRSAVHAEELRMERKTSTHAPTQGAASRGFETADGVAVTPGQQVWVFGTCGLTAAEVDKPVTNYLLWSSPIPVSKSYSSKEAALAAQAKRAGA